MIKTTFAATVALLLSTATASAQHALTGNVIAGDTRQPLAGATVKVEGTNIATTTDEHGYFCLPDISKGTAITVSYVGMATKSVKAKPDMTITVTPDSNTLDEVIVQVAYGAARKSTLTGAVSQIDSKDIALRPVTMATSALEGLTTGVQVNSTYGEPGTTPDIRIRGFGTVNGSSSPLYIVDGMPFTGSIADISTADIESITVLKDAASCALYGNRASNGVILITTKRGKGSKINFDLSIKQGTYSRGIGEYSTLSQRQFMESSWQSLRNMRITAGDTPETAAQYATANLIKERLYLNIFNKPDDQLFDAYGKLDSEASVLNGYQGDFDWYDAALRHGYRQEYNFSGSQATDKADYYFSVGYLDENGYVKNSGFNRITGRATMNFRPKTWLHAGISMSGTHQKSNVTDGTSTNGLVNIFNVCRYVAPIYPVHLHNTDGSYRLDSNGSRQYDKGLYVDEEGNTVLTRNIYQNRNIIWENLLNTNRQQRDALQMAAHADVNLPYGFVFTVKGNLETSTNNLRTYYNAEVGDGVAYNGITTHTDRKYKSYDFMQQLRWNRTYGNHTLEALAGHENYSYRLNYGITTKSNQTFAGQDDLNNFTVVNSVTGYTLNYRTESYLARLRYDYLNRYNLEASFRRDGSSRFSKEQRWGNFGSIGANWIVSKEAFMKDLTWLNNLKARADYGIVGNDAGANYIGYMALYQGTKINDNAAYFQYQLANDNLKWEASHSFGIGIEARMFNLWNFSAEYFDKRNKDLLFNVNLPLSAGSNNIKEAEATITHNIGTISNRGFELSTDIDVYSNRQWTVNIAANATLISNKVTKLPDQNKDGIVDGVYKVAEGKSRYEFYLPTFAGVDYLTGNSLYKADLEKFCITTADGQTIGNANGTNITKAVTQINGQYYTNNTGYALKEFHGSALPKAYGSFAANISYKSWSLNALFTYSLGGKVYDAVYQQLMSTENDAANRHTDIMKAWTAAPEGMTEQSANRLWVNGVPQTNSALTSTNNATSSRWLTSASYLVAKSITLSYELPKAWVYRLALQRVGLHAACENLFTCTSRKGLNPQQSFSGYQYNYLVTPRIFTVGIDIKF